MITHWNELLLLAYLVTGFITAFDLYVKDVLDGKNPGLFSIGFNILVLMLFWFPLLIISIYWYAIKAGYCIRQTDKK